jgi:hypothetical protein
MTAMIPIYDSLYDCFAYVFLNIACGEIDSSRYGERKVAGETEGISVDPDAM